MSGDARDRAERARTDWGLEALPIGYGLTSLAMRQWGLYVSKGLHDEPPAFNEPAFFLVRPNGTLYGAALSSMPYLAVPVAHIVAAIERIRSDDFPARGEA